MEAVKWVLGYLGIGLAVATAFGCWCKLGSWHDHLMDCDLEGLWMTFLLWPLVVLAFPIFVIITVFEELEKSQWWQKLPDSKDLYPVEWLFCWPVKLYELWRKRHDGRKEDGDGDSGK